MTTVLLVRHGLTAVTGKILLGWTPGVSLDDRGRGQAERLAARLADLPIDAFVSSPLERCQETIAAIAAVRPSPGGSPSEPPPEPADRTTEQTTAEIVVDDRLGECKYGDWTGQELAVLAKEPLWRVVQEHPSAVVFPGEGGEALRETQARSVAAVRDWNALLGPDATWLACSHGDVIKAIVADAMGMHLDLYQRITIDPCSLTVIHYTERRPFVQRVNDVGGSVAELVTRAKEKAKKQAEAQHADQAQAADAAEDPLAAGDGVVGGGAGADA